MNVNGFGRKTWWLAGGVAAAFAGRELLRRLGEADLSGRVVVITGGSRGLGLLLAREFAHEGCRIAICSRNEAQLEMARRDLEGHVAQVLAIKCDIGDEAQARNLIQEVTRRYGGVDILVNNAGVIQVGPVQNMTVKDFEDAMRIMFWGVLYPTLEVLPQMLSRRSGRIVNITSIGGKVSVPHLLPYGCAKFAAVALSEGLRAELGGKGVQVITIAPGLMRTGSFLNALFKGRQEREYAWFSLGAALPGMSMSAERAARQIVKATKRGEAERILTTQANLLARFHGLFPGLTADLLGLANRLVLPSAEGGTEELAAGREIKQRVGSTLMNTLTRMGVSAAERYNELPGTATA